MPATTAITVPQLSRLVGLPNAPIVVDVRIESDRTIDPRLFPCSVRRDFNTVHEWSKEFLGQPVAVACQKGLKLSQGVAAWLRHEGVAAEFLEGGFEAWRDGSGILIDHQNLPERNDCGHTLWVTRARPKVDRIACPWLIRRFVDPGAIFLFVEPSEVLAVADRFGATPFDVENVFWSHRGEGCTFDTMIEAFGLRSKALEHLAAIVRAADTGRFDLAPEAKGLLAASLGLSRMYRDDLKQLDAAMPLYDAFFRWCRDATGEVHNWPAAGQAS